MKKILVLLLIVVFVGACDKGFDELNVNPTKPSQLGPAIKFTYVQLHTQGGWYGTELFYNVLQLMPNVQHINITSYHNSFTYQEGKNVHFFWSDYYSEPIKNIVDLEAQLSEAEDATAAGDLAIVGIQKVLIFSRLTDVFGDLPYSEAAKGFLEGIRFPKYDAQSDIYADMLATLESSVTTLNGGATNSFEAADRMYGGDNVKWSKFANSLMLRLAMRMIKVDADGAQTWATKAIAGGVMESNDDIAYLMMEDHPDDQGPNVNQLTKCFTSRHQNQIKISATFMDYMKSRNDPRVSVLCSTVDGDTDFALQTGQDINDFSRGDANSKPNVNIFGGNTTGGPIVLYDAPYFFQTYAEVEFMLAEAAERWGLAGGDVEAHYNAGVTAAMQYLALYGHGVHEITQTEIDAYLLANPFEAANAIQQINEQYWVATFGNGIEAFSNWRRTGYPVLTPLDIAATLTGGEIPRRFVYPGSEKLSNTDNVEAAIANQGGENKNTTRVWWDN